MSTRMSRSPPASLRFTRRLETIQSIIESGTWILRHPAGAGAESSIEGRKAASDEDYYALQAADDDTWYSIMEERTGLAIRPKD
jgi:hypothetical protein